MGTRVLISCSAVAALVQEPTHPSPVTVPPVPVVAGIDGGLIDGDIRIVCMWVSSWFSTIVVVAPLGAPRPGRLLALRVCAVAGHVALPFAVIACCRGETLVLRQMVYGQPSMFCAPFSSALCPRTLSLGGH